MSWGKYKLSDVCISIADGDHQPPPKADNGIPFVTISDITNTNKFDLTDTMFGTILVSFKLTVGRVSIATGDMCTNEAIAHFYIKEKEFREYTYMYLKTFEYDILGNTSSISKAVNSKIIKSMPFIMPSGYVIGAFSNRVKPFLDLIYSKQCTIIDATEARDRLLSKLMNGEIEV